MNGLSFLLVLDIGLEVGSFLRYFGGGSQRIELEFSLIEQLAVAIVILDQAEGLFLVHFMLFDLLNLVFFITMQHVSAELVLVVFEGGAVVARVEVGGH
jgi:hypothetical protein